jgi:YesN/AraC family two-component response regulator
MTTTRVAIVDDQDLVRTGFRMILEDLPDLEIVGEASDGAQAVRLVESYRPDVTLMDVRMPVMEGSKPPGVSSAATHPRGSSY